MVLIKKNKQDFKKSKDFKNENSKNENSKNEKFKILWLKISNYINDLEDPINSNNVFLFLNIVEKEIPCSKCKLHFKNFKKPEKFNNKKHVKEWFDLLQQDIEKQKRKNHSISVLNRKIGK